MNRKVFVENYIVMHLIAKTNYGKNDALNKAGKNYRRFPSQEVISVEQLLEKHPHQWSNSISSLFPHSPVNCLFLHYSLLRALIHSGLYPALIYPLVAPYLSFNFESIHLVF